MKIKSLLLSVVYVTFCFSTVAGAKTQVQKRVSATKMTAKSKRDAARKKAEKLRREKKEAEEKVKAKIEEPEDGFGGEGEDEEY